MFVCTLKGTDKKIYIERTGSQCLFVPCWCCCCGVGCYGRHECGVGVGVCVGTFIPWHAPLASAGAGGYKIKTRAGIVF